LVIDPRKFFSLSGRKSVWAEGVKLFKESPVLGYGFHADRLLLGTHMHNALLHALIQTGVIGSVPFMAALIWAWVLQIKALRNRPQLPAVHRHLVIQVAGVLAFLSLRAVTESTGAFFGVDWLLLAPLLLYLQVVNQKRYQSLSAA
jgi:O-antigen ligase